MNFFEELKEVFYGLDVLVDLFLLLCDCYLDVDVCLLILVFLLEINVIYFFDIEVKDCCVILCLLELIIIVCDMC